MAEKWYEGLPDATFITEEDRAYERAFATIRAGLAQGLDFDSACARIDVPDEVLRKNITADMLKVLIAEEHFSRHVPLEELAARLKIQPDRLETAKKEMFEDVEKTATNTFHKEMETSG